MRKKRWEKSRCGVLHEACKKGAQELEATLRYMGGDIDINSLDDKGNTVLHTACAKNDLEMVKVILKYGKDSLDINKVNKKGFTPLYIACRGGCVRIIKLLLTRKNVNINATDREGDTVFHEVFDKGNKEIAKLLLSYPHMRADLNASDKRGYTPLQMACGAGKADLVKMILYYPYVKVHINQPDESGFTALHMACREGKMEIIKLLQDYQDEKLDLNVVSKDGITPLHAASSSGNVEVVKMLLKSGEIDINDINKVTKNGITALHIATNMENTDVVKALLESIGKRKGVDILNRENITPLQIACKKGNEEIAEMLINASANINIANVAGYTSMHTACEEGYRNVIELLVKNESTNMNLFNKDNETPLHIACGEPSGEMLELLLTRRDVNINANKKGMTPLCQACKYGYINVVKKLLAVDGIDITIVPNKIGNITRLIKGENSKEIIEMLQEKASDELLEVCECGDDIERVNKLINIVKDYIPDEKLISLLEVSSSKIMRVFVNKLDVDRMSRVLSGSDYDTRIRLIDTIIEVEKILKKILKKVSEDVKVLIEDRINERNATKGCKDKGDKNKEDKNEEDNSNQSKEKQLLNAVKSRDVSLVKQLLNKGVNLDVRDEHGRNSLMIAINKGYNDLVRLILEKGIDVEAVDDRGKTALIYAVENNNSDVTKILLSVGADVNAKDNNDRTVLMYALRCGESMSFIIDNLLDDVTYMTDLRGVTLLMHACVGGYMTAIEKILNLGIDINAADENGRTAVGIACSKDDTELVEYLVNKGAFSPGSVSYNEKTKFKTLLHKISKGKLGGNKSVPEEKEVSVVERIDTSRNSKKNKNRYKFR